ncbi:MAG TPA: Gfo/Idh/MocA family oxidoreductase, partial [Polyangiales bacterium]|nr:Gfo/Idh/MocA family oxidoreductase [Polyangiales bacterium]
MTDPIGIALVGCGVISYTHADAIARIPDARVTALIDVDSSAANSLADHIEGHGRARPASFASLTEALAGGGIDVVTILTPSGLHVALAADAIDAGMHVIIEKPLDVSLPRARQILALADAANEKGLVVSVISQHRFDPSSVVVHDAVERGEFGRLTSGIASIAWWRSQEYYDSAGWRGSWALDGGGAAMNQGVHTIDLLLWLFGDPVEVSARTAALTHDRIEVEDTLVATITFASGALGLV